MKSALYIGRFQPFHNGHLDAIRQIVENGYNKVVIGIGSCQESRTKNNPLSLNERSFLIKSALENEGIDNLGNSQNMISKSPYINYDIVPIPDFHNNKLWTKYILDNASFDDMFTNNNWTKECFEEASNKQVYTLKERVKVCATQVRNAIVNGDDWKHFVSENVAQNIVKNGLEKVIVKSCRPELKTPYLAVDGIIEVDNGIVLIERANEPKGYALPGGFVDYNESCESALIREMYEEVNLEISNLKLLGMYSNPSRDPRQHVASVVYVAKANGIPKQGDDAKKAFVVPIEQLEKYNLVFDHRKIINDYLEAREKC